MKKLGPGCNEPDWTMTVQCVGGDGSGWGNMIGCGAPLLIDRNDLYVVSLHDDGGGRKEVRFTCLCGVENKVPQPESKILTNLPTEEVWKAKQAAQQE